MGLLNLMSKDDWIYSALLIFSFGLALFIRKQPNNILISGVIGFSMALFILGYKIFYSIIGVLLVLAAQQFVPKSKVTLYVFVMTFVYLMVVRFIHYILPVDELASHANVVQLIITLRVIGLTFEISDAENHRKAPKEQPNKRFLTEIPDVWHRLAYFYNFCGLFTGPYYTYQMLLDSQNPALKNWSPNDEIMQRLTRLTWSVPAFVITNFFLPLDTLRLDSIWDVSFFTRLVYAALIFVVFKTRVYSAWAIAESICVALGIGIYPAASKPKIIIGPTDLENYEKNKDNISDLNSEAIVNLDIAKVEFSDGFRDGMKSWNRSVQTWLAIYVHSRVKFMRVETTMLVSAIWHGVYAGYFLSFGVVAMCAKLEDVIFRLVPADETTNLRPTWFRVLYTHTIRCRGFEMLATGFLLKNFFDVMHFWSSIYFWLPLLCIPFYVYDLMYPVKRKSK